jgi:hypothetical protein
MGKYYIKQDKQSQEEILLKDITAKSWSELASAMRARAKKLQSVADAFERYEREGEPFPNQRKAKRKAKAA